MGVYGPRCMTYTCIVVCNLEKLAVWDLQSYATIQNCMGRNSKLPVLNRLSVHKEVNTYTKITGFRGKIKSVFLACFLCKTDIFRVLVRSAGQ